MRQRKYGILSLDISSKSTGWSFSVKDRVCAVGTIKITIKDPGKRLVFFRRKLGSILDKYHPANTLIENGWGGKNMVTLKTLCEFAGVAKELCYIKTGKNAFIINNKTTKAHFKVQTKEELFYEIVKIYGWENKGLLFKDHNDITDAVAQSVYFFEKIMGGHCKGNKGAYNYEDDLFINIEEEVEDVDQIECD